MTIDRKGVTRIVFLTKNSAIKIPNFTCQWDHFLKGLLANINEARTWKVAKEHYPENKHLLCPVKWSSWGGWILIMERAVAFDPQTEQWSLDYSEWEKAGYSGDDKPQNYGMLKGRIVKLDYA